MALCDRQYPPNPLCAEAKVAIVISNKVIHLNSRDWCATNDQQWCNKLHNYVTANEYHFPWLLSTLCKLPLQPAWQLKRIQGNIAWVCLTLQCSVNCCICCAVDNCIYCVYQNHPNISNCLPDSATLRSLLAVSTSPCITASTTASLSLTPARAPVEDQVTFHNEQKIIKQHTQLSYVYYTIYSLN